MDKVEHLPTHTWEGRNVEALETLASTLKNWKAGNLRVIDIGPGGLAEKFAPYFPKGSKANLGFMDKKRKQIANAFESRERDKAGTRLVCYEANEVERVLAPLGIERIFFVDKFKKVLDAVQQNYSGNTPYEVLQRDIEKQPVSSGNTRLRANAVIALNVLSRCEHDINYALRNIFESVEDGGYLLISEIPDTLISGFTRLNNFGADEKYSIYWRGERPDKARKRWSARGPALNEEAIVKASMSVGSSYSHKI